MTATAGSERLGSAGGCVRSNMAEFAADDRRSVGWARAFVRAELAGFAAVDDAALCVSELATNAVLHGSDRGVVFWVVVRRGDGWAYVAVIDCGGGSSVPGLVEAEGGAEEGRGLWLVAELASAWGVERALTGGCRVWAEVAAA